MFFPAGICVSRLRLWAPDIQDMLTLALRSTQEERINMGSLILLTNGFIFFKSRV